MKVEYIPLGISASVPMHGRHLPAHLIKAGKVSVLLDAGDGVQYQLQKTSVSPLSLDAILVTHMHPDHYAGLFGLLWSMDSLNRTRPLVVIGPPELAKLISTEFGLAREGPNFEIEFVDVRRIVGKQLELANGFAVSAFPACHTVPAWGYRIEISSGKRKVLVEKLREAGLPPKFWGRLQRGETVQWNGKVFTPEEYTVEPPKKVIAYTGDTAPCESVIQGAYGADLLIHEATYLADREQFAHERGHSTALDAAKDAAEAKVAKLILTHFSPKYKDLQPFLEEAEVVFPNTELAEELKTYKI